MTDFINLSNHASIKLLPDSPWITSISPRTGREIKAADLKNEELTEPTVKGYLAAYQVEMFPGNTNSVYPNPMIKQLLLTVYDEVLEDGTIITHNVGGKTVVEDLPEPQEGVIFITSYAVAQAAQRKDLVSPNTIADPATGSAIGAFGYIAFG